MSDKKIRQPLYQKEVYGWLYDSPKWTKFFDSKKKLGILTFGNSSKFIESLLKEIKISNKVLQIGATFGDQIEKTADKIGFYGKYDLVDVNKNQLARVEEKYKYLYPKMNFILQDGSTKFDEKYDVVICYMLLHEVPLATKTKIINNVLASLNEKGKAVFIDYNNPESWHPLRYLVRMFNRLYQPFAEKMWDREIHSFASNKSGFTWRKTTFFGRMYQKVVATRREKIIDSTQDAE